MMRAGTRAFGYIAIALVIAVWLTASALSWKDSASQNAEEAIELYKQKKLDEALKKITAAQLEAPNSPQLQYNLGNILYKKGKFDQARAGYQIAAQASQIKLKQAAYYNAGNASFMAGDYNGAIDNYTKALLLDPADESARYNLEIALRMRKQQQKGQTNKENKQQGKQGSSQQEQKREGTKSPKQKNQQVNEQKNRKQQGKASQQKAEQKKAKRQKPPGESRKAQRLSKDQIDRILAALQNEELRVVAQRQKQQGGSVVVEKDW